MMSRNYSSTAAEASLASGVSGSATLLQVSSVSGFPSVPFTLIVDPDTVSEEIVTVTAVAGTSLTVTRGEDGTSGVSHEVGAKVRHGVSARDLREPQQHIAASTGVHGVGSGSSVVGTETSQTLSNKVLDASNDVEAGALPSGTVFTTGAQNISDKVFDTSNTYRASTPVTDSQVTPKSYVDAQALPVVGWLDEYSATEYNVGSTPRILYSVAVPVKSFARMLQVAVMASLSVDANTGHRVKIELVDTGAPVEVDEGTVVASQPCYNSLSTAQRINASPSARILLDSGADKTVRVWVQRVTGTGTATINDEQGVNTQLDWVKIAAGNNW